MKARHIIASLALLSCAAHAQPVSKIIAIAPETATNPMMALSTEACSAPGYGNALRAFVGNGGSSTAEACWVGSPAGDAVSTCRLQVPTNRRSAVSTRCWVVALTRFNKVTRPL